jgi:hypothetical protein
MDHTGICGIVGILDVFIRANDDEPMGRRNPILRAVFRQRTSHASSSALL